MQQVEDVPPPTLKGGGVELLPCRDEHFPLLHRWESDGTSLHLWAGRRAILSYSEFEESLRVRLRNYFHLFFVLSAQEIPVGFVYSYDVSLTDGIAFVTVYLAPEKRRLGLGVKATALFVDYLFAQQPIRKVYCDVFEYNAHSLAVLKNAGFEVEGCLLEHHFFRGAYHALFRLAIKRATFYEKHTSLLRRLYRA